MSPVAARAVTLRRSVAITSKSASAVPRLPVVGIDVVERVRRGLRERLDAPPDRRSRSRARRLRAGCRVRRARSARRSSPRRPVRRGRTGGRRRRSRRRRGTRSTPGSRSARPHDPFGDAARVLDGNEPEVADELTRASCLLPRRQRRRAECEEVALDRSHRRGGGCRLSAPRVRDQALEGPVELRRSGGSTLADEGVSQDPPVPARRRRRAGGLLREAGAEHVAGVGERRPEKSLVGVEEVASNRPDGSGAGDDPVGERGDRDARGGAQGARSA